MKHDPESQCVLIHAICRAINFESHRLDALYVDDKTSKSVLETLALVKSRINTIRGFLDSVEAQVNNLEGAAHIRLAEDANDL